jgi:glycosyltransferase involved in cell wall biosynthesis
MKILQIHNFYRTPGGECGVVEAEKELLKAHGHPVFRFVAHSLEIETMTLAAKGMAFLQVPYNLQSARRLGMFIRTHQPDVAHVHNVFPLLSPSVYAVCKSYSVPVVQTVHNFRFMCPNGLFFTKGEICEACLQQGFMAAVKNRCMHDSLPISALYAAAIALAWGTGNVLRNIDRYIALTDFVRDKLAAGGVPREKIRVCGNFIGKFSEAPARKGNYALYIGRLSSEKGLGTLLSAFRRVPDLTLKIAGSGPMEAVLKQYVNENAMYNVEFIGFVAGGAKQRLIEEALCTIIPSEWYENFPMSVVESLACGTPVIASRIGGLPEMIEHNKTGLLFSPGDDEELVKCICKILACADFAKEMAAQTLEMARERFSPERHLAELLKIFEEAQASPTSSLPR